MKNNLFFMGSFLLLLPLFTQSFVAADYVLPGLYEKYTTWDATNRKLLTPGQGGIIFKAQAATDITIGFSPTVGTQNPMYEIVLGAWNNTKSVLRRATQVQDFLQVVNGSPCNANQAQTYWVAVDEANKTISAGTGSTIGQNVIISYKDDNFIPNIQYFAFTSWDQPITFIQS